MSGTGERRLQASGTGESGTGERRLQVSGKGERR